MRRLIKYIAFVFLITFSLSSYSQCDVYDGDGNPTNAPYWLSCFGTDFTLNLQSPSTFGAYTIDWGDGSPIETGTSFAPPSFIPHTYTATVDTFVVTFTETSSGCVIQGVVVMEEPTTASIQIPFGGVTQTCAPASLEFTNSSTNTSPTTIFTWDFGDGSPQEVYDYTNSGVTVTHTYQRGTVDCETFVSLTAENYCNTSQGGPSTATFNPIRIWDLDEAAINASATLLCYPDTTVVYDNATNRNCLTQGNTFQRQEYWNFGDYWGLGYDSIVDWTPWPPTFPYTIAYPGIGTYTTMLIDSNYCGVDTAYITVNIVPPPTAAFTLSKDTVCVDEIFTATNNSTGGANGFSWNFGDGSGWQTTNNLPQTHSYIAPGDYTISLVALINGGQGCTDTVTAPIHVLPSPNANFVLDNNNGCDSLTINFTDASTNAIAWSWDFGNGNTDNTNAPPSQFYPSPGTYPVSLSVTSLNTCTNTITQNVNIYQSPAVSFIPLSVCENTVATFTDQSTSAAGDPIITWNWDFGNGNTSTNQNPNNQYTSNGSFMVNLQVATAFCSSTDSLLVSVEPVPTASFTQDQTQGCPILPVNFSNTSIGATSYNWDFGDNNNSTMQDPTNNFQNINTTNANYTITMIASTAFGCTDTAYSSVTVYPGVIADFTDNGFPGCAPLDVNFTNLSTTGQTYAWDFGDGSGSNTYNTTHQYINSTLFIDVYHVSLVVTSADGCVDSASNDITVYPIPNFGFSSVPDSGCSPLSVSFPSVIGAVSYQWDFGDGNTGTGPTPTHLYSNSTTNDVVYNVQLIATSPFGCVDTTGGTVKVFPNPTSQFTPTSAQGCAPFNAEFQNLSIGSVSYDWSYGDGNSSTDSNALHTHLYYNTTSTPLNYDISLIAYSDRGCSDTSTQTITVFPTVTAAFTGDTAGCTPVQINFTNQSMNSTSWNWDFGDGIVDVTPNPSHFYTNSGTTDTTYTASLVAVSSYGCSDTAYQDILVYPTPNAQFTAIPVNQTFPSTTVDVTNTSTLGSWNYNWDYGDGSTISGLNPSPYSYSTWGNYTITLVVASPYCSDTTTQDIVINPPPPLPEFYGSGAGCRPFTIQFTDSSTYVDTYFWEFGDGGTSTQANPLYTYYVAGTYNVTLTVTGPGGTASIVHIDSVDVYEQASAFFQLAPTSVYVPGESVLFYNLSNFADTYFWDFGDGGTSTDEHPEYFYNDPGTYDVMLIANNANNCPDTLIISEAVLAEAGGEVNFPNAFTPNTNGPSGGQYDPNAIDNDIFFPVFKGVNEYHLEIFNRWGELIFETFDPMIGWDGYYRGELVQQDVYIWKAKVKFTNGKEDTYVGEVHLIK